ncbi:hypothetical protein [Carnobacterium maltaromaticum]|uniref:hypothetical protein n=1 Tax=Carnobacterium maltaromaticum TaxID=2751 RepID=UPI00295EAF4D|nr:hypothetical protein [Carnobacterium maltaromaticum]
MKIKFQLNGTLSLGYSIDEILDFIDDLSIKIDHFQIENNRLISNLVYDFKTGNGQEKIGIIKITDTLFPRKEKLEHIINCEILIEDTLKHELKSITSIFNVELELFKSSLKRYFICKGKNNYRKKYFSRCFWVSDCQSKIINQVLSSKFYSLENKLREVINEVLTYNLGSDWSAEYTRIYKLSRSSTDYIKKVSIFKDIEHDLTMLLTDELADIIMSPGISLSNDANNIEKINDVLEQIMIDAFNKNGKISDTQFRENIKNSSLFNKEANSLHEEFFSHLDQSGDRMLKNLWEDATKRRNHIAHNKPLDIDFYIKTEQQFNKIEILLDDYLAQFDLIEKEVELVSISKEWGSEEDYLLKVSGEIENPDNEQVPSTCQNDDGENDNFDLDLFESHQAFAEEEAGVYVRSDKEIVNLIGEIVDTQIDRLFELANDLDLIITKNNSFGEETILLEVEHEMIENNTMKIETIYQNIDSSRGAVSEIRIIVKVDDQDYEECFIKYTNPDYEFNEHQSNYMPTIREDLDIHDFNELIEKMIEYLDNNF